MTARFPIIVAAEQASQSAGNTERAVILLGLFTLIGTITTAIISALANRNASKAKQHAAEANDAVNHRQPDQPRLFDTVNNMQAQMNNVHRSMVNLQEQHQQQHNEVMSEVTDLRQQLNDHVQWEMTQKYGDGSNERRKGQLPYEGTNRRMEEPS